MPLSPGQHVAACVPYTKRRTEWILAKIERWYDAEKQFRLFNSIINNYIVKDLFPDKRKKVDSWQVEPAKVIPFPAGDNETFETGNRVLSLWLENTEWSSMFYEAFVVQTLQRNDATIKLKYNGDNKIYSIDKTKVIRYDDSKVVEQPKIELEVKKIKPAKQTKPSNVSTRSKAAKTRSRKSMELESPSSKKVKRESSPPPLQLPSGYFDQKEKKTLQIEQKEINYSHFVPTKPTLNRPLNVLGKKMRNYQNTLLERNNANHQAMLLNFNFR